MLAADSTAGSLVGLLVLAGVIGWALSLWLFVLMVRFFSAGRKAFDRYLFMTSDPIRPVPRPQVAPGGRTTEPPGRKHRS